MFFIYVCEELIIQIFNFQKHSYNLNKFFFKFTKILQRKKTVVFSLPLWLTSSLRYRKSGNELFFSLPPQRQLEVNVPHTIVLEDPFFVFDTWRSEWFKSNYWQIGPGLASAVIVWKFILLRTAPFPAPAKSQWWSGSKDTHAHTSFLRAVFRRWGKVVKVKQKEMGLGGENFINRNCYTFSGVCRLEEEENVEAGGAVCDW